VQKTPGIMCLFTQTQRATQQALLLLFIHISLTYHHQDMLCHSTRHPTYLCIGLTAFAAVMLLGGRTSSRFTMAANDNPAALFHPSSSVV
jgi:hypothetical protein